MGEMEKDSISKRKMITLLVSLIIIISGVSIFWYFSGKELGLYIFPPDDGSSNITIKINGVIIYEEQQITNGTTAVPHPFFDYVTTSTSGVNFEIYVEESDLGINIQDQLSIFDGGYIIIGISDDITIEQSKEKIYYE